MRSSEAIKYIKVITKHAIDDGFDSEAVDACSMAVWALTARVSKWDEYAGASAYNCHLCGNWSGEKTQFCPNCGAKMEVVKDETGD